MDDAALTEMSRVYGEAWRRLDARLRAVTKQIEAEAARVGLDEVKVKHPNWLYRHARYRELMNQLDEDMVSFSRTAAAMVGDQQRRGWEMGEAHAQQLARLSLGDPGAGSLVTGYGLSWNRVPREAVESLVGFLADGSPLSYKFAGLPREVADQIKQVFAAGLAQGWNPRKIAATIKREFAGGLDNALTVCRTETMRAYRTAAMESYRANDDIVEGWIWMSAHGPRTCAACWAMDGTFHPLSEEFNDHVRGRCTMVPRTKTWAELGGGDATGVTETRAEPWDPESEFRKLSVKQQMRVLGPQKYRLWRDGKIGLRDMARVAPSKVWGDSVRRTAIADLVKEAKITREEAKAASKL